MAIILVVDDTAVARSGLKGMLTPVGYTVITAVDGEDALEKAKTEKPDLVLTDLGMPGMSGYELVRALRQADLSVPVVAMTSYLDIIVVEQFKEAGGDGILSKASSVEEIQNVVARWLASKPRAGEVRDAA